MTAARNSFSLDAAPACGCPTSGAGQQASPRPLFSTARPAVLPRLDGIKGGVPGRNAGPPTNILRAIAAAALTAFAAPAAAQEPVCLPQDSMRALLAEHYGEAPVWVGLSSQGALVEIHGNADTSSWTMVIIDPTGRACFAVAGGMWMVMPEVEGDPA